MKNLPFQTALDAFCGTGCVAYKMKQNEKNVSVYESHKLKYVLSSNISKEVLIVGK